MEGSVSRLPRTKLTVTLLVAAAVLLGWLQGYGQSLDISVAAIIGFSLIFVFGLTKRVPEKPQGGK